MADSYLTKTFSGAPTNAKKGTFSGWFKLSSGSDTYYRIFVSGADQNNRTDINITNPVNSSNASAGEINMQHYISGTGYFLVTNRLLRDLNGWYHILVSYDTTLATGSDRVKLYVNGTRETSFSTSDMNNIPQNTDLFWGNNSSAHHIGNSPHFSPRFFNGHMSHVAFVDGTAYTPTSFGETDSTSGIWKFKSPSGVTWGNNGFHLKFENSGNLGLDSANTNNFTVNGNLKQALDTPSNVYATLNPLHPSLNTSRVFTTGNNTIELGGTGRVPEVSTLGMTTGKWYAEAQRTGGSGGNILLGITGQMFRASNIDWLGSKIYDFAYYGASGDKANNTNETSFGNSFTTGDIIGIAVDLDNNKIYFSKNGTWQNSGDPTSGSTGTGSAFDLTAPSSTVDGAYFFACSDDNAYASRTIAWNFGNGYFGTTAIASAGSNGNGSLFEYDVPSGYYALNTKNINTYG